MFKKHLKSIILALIFVIFVVVVIDNGSSRRQFIQLSWYKLRGNYQSLNKIDHIYLLNLDRSSARLTRMTKIVAEMNLGQTFERFSAVDGKKIQFENLDDGTWLNGSELKIGDILNGNYKIYCSSNSNLSKNYFDANFADLIIHKRFVGEIGCACSHRQIWRDIIKNDYKNVLILEDDIRFVRFAREILSRALNYLPSDYNMIYLGLMYKLDSFDKNFSSKYYKKVVKSSASGESYILTNVGARILIDNYQTYSTVVDEYVSSLIEKNILKAYSIKPLLTRQIGGSIIDNN